jgi:hypothetical protein
MGFALLAIAPTTAPVLALSQAKGQRMILLHKADFRMNVFGFLELCVAVCSHTSVT